MDYLIMNIENLMEGVYGRGLSKMSIEGVYGRGLSKMSIEGVYGRGLWKGSIEEVYGRGLSKGSIYCSQIFDSLSIFYSILLYDTYVEMSIIMSSEYFYGKCPLCLWILRTLWKGFYWRIVIKGLWLSNVLFERVVTKGLCLWLSNVLFEGLS